MQTIEKKAGGVACVTAKHFDRIHSRAFFPLRIGFLFWRKVEGADGRIKENC